MATNGVLDRKAFLAELGYSDPAAQTAAIEVLVKAKLTTPKKTGIAAEKRSRCRDVLSRHLVLLCRRCRSVHGQDARKVVPAAKAADCERCHDQPNRLAVKSVAALLRRSGVSRVVVVGGSPRLRRELDSLWPRDLELRLVSGTGQHTLKDAKANLDWADVVVIWGPTQLKHKVSKLYEGRAASRTGQVISVRRRGIEALCQELRTWAGRRQDRAN